MDFLLDQYLLLLADSPLVLLKWKATFCNSSKIEKTNAATLLS